MKWTDSDNLHAREAAVVGGPNEGLRVAVRLQGDRFRHPDVVDMTGYLFDEATWRFYWTGRETTTLAVVDRVWTCQHGTERRGYATPTANCREARAADCVWSEA